MKHFFALSLFLIVFSSTYAQQALPVPGNTIETLEEKFSKTFTEQKARAEKISAETGTLLKQQMPNGQMIRFGGFDATNQMIFNITHNIGSGRTISANKVWPGGSTGTSLTGAGLTGRLGEWDGGVPRVTHQEFQGRITIGDGSTDYQEHATHVAGTMIAAGVSANAKGMSYEAPLRAYDWDNDESEMAAAAANGMLLSNHSYGSISGWYYNSNLSRWEWYGNTAISAVEDYKFGFYDQRAADWDLIAVNNPSYLICKSAGNDRGDSRTGTHYVLDGSNNWVSSTATRNADGNANGYDCISTNGTAKNVMTVGAVEKINNSNSNNGWTQASDVVMSSFSGWGPTDDGRIKPDVVSAGVDIYSPVATSNTAYDNSQGTSMASPAVTGGLLLVQQHHRNLKGKFMRAATLKGLAIHTADEAGTSAGPDYRFGWGLLNIAKAVQLLTDSTTNQVQERTLANSSTYTQTITSEGTTPLRITISWTDPVGTPMSPALDPTNLMLVNDLDIRLTRTSDNTVFSPYILNPANPAAAATTGDNFRDNVEQIYVAAPSAGNYILTVSHKGILASSQAYSLIVSGVSSFPEANILANTRATCLPGNITFTDISSGMPTARTWYFPGGTPSTATTAAVGVTYTKAGTYPVALKVSNSLGTDSIYLENYISVGGIPLPFTETFEFTSPSVNSWVITNGNNDTTWRLATTGGTAPGNRSYCMPFYNYAQTGRRDGLSTPVLNFKGYKNVALSFQYAYTRDLSAQSDSLIVYISTNCGTSYSRLAQYAENGTGNFRTVPDTDNQLIPSAASQWCVSTCINLDLSAYSDLANVRLKFEGYNRNGNNLYIDNVVVSGTMIEPNANLYAPKTTVCTGEPVNFMDSSKNIIDTWQWTFAGAATVSSSAQNPQNIVYNTPGIYPVKLVVTNAAGTDSITRQNYITVLQSPGTPNLKNSRPLVFCSGDSTVLSTDSSGTKYEWYRNGVLMPASNVNSITVKDSAMYRVYVYNANNCIGATAPTAVVMYVKPNTPIISSSLTSSLLCPGLTAVFTSSVNTGNQWYRNEVLLAGQTGKTMIVSDSGTYKVIATNGICSTTSANRILGLHPKPAIGAVSGTTSPHYGEQTTHTIPAKAGATYLWKVLGGVIVGDSTQTSVTVKWNYTDTAWLKVLETTSNVCPGVQHINMQMQWPVGVQEAATLKSTRIYPNPASQVLHVDFTTQTTDEATVSISNMIGQTLLSDHQRITNGIYEHTFNLKGLESGIYFVRIRAGNETRVEKIVIE